MGVEWIETWEYSSCYRSLVVGHQPSQDQIVSQPPKKLAAALFLLQLFVLEAAADIVVFPAPFTPKTITNSPLGISRSMSFSIDFEP